MLGDVSKISNVAAKMDESEKNINENKNCRGKEDDESDSIGSLEQQDSITNPDEIHQESEGTHSTDFPSATDAAKCCNGTLNDENLTKQKIAKEEDNSEITTNELSSMNSSKLSQAVPSNISTSHPSNPPKSMPESSLSSVLLSNGTSGGGGGVTSIQDECRTSVLIKKQMNEIDREINRRIQNRNIKKIDEKELAQLLSSVNSCSYQSACTQLQYPSVYAISADTTNQSALSFGCGEERKLDASTSKPTLEQLRNSFALPIVSSNSVVPSQSSTCHRFQQQQQQQQQFPALYLGMPGGPPTDCTAMVPSQNCCSASLPTTVTQFTHAAAAASAVAAFGTISPQSYPQFQPYFQTAPRPPLPPPQSAPPPPSHAYYFPSTHQHISPEVT
ncbi:unnamed protein product [Litomosoides sigmodontis]|uniref:Uncharacterized protein n=1 Tax=Litomosoides sigmodontis TaxID=42156 RepID=A0A3P6S7L5_LITSI|nr:unnamed protein product [Litomosoides sigmodontis]